MRDRSLAQPSCGDGDAGEEGVEEGVLQETKLGAKTAFVDGRGGHNEH